MLCDRQYSRWNVESALAILRRSKPRGTLYLMEGRSTFDSAALYACIMNSLNSAQKA